MRKNLSQLLAVSFLLLANRPSASLAADGGESSNRSGSQPGSVQPTAKASGSAKESGLGGYQSKFSSRTDSPEQKAAKLQAACAAYKGVAQNFLTTRNDEQALSYLDHVVNISPKQDPQAYYLRALALSRLKRFEPALDDVDKAIQLYPTKVDEETRNCHALRLAILQNLGQAAKALDEQKKFANYLKGAKAPDIKSTMQLSQMPHFPQKRWHPYTPLPILDPKQAATKPRATQQP
jgi:tetratricopeptide (TPR) repeat protein